MSNCPKNRKYLLNTRWCVCVKQTCFSHLFSLISDIRGLTKSPTNSITISPATLWYMAKGSQSFVDGRLTELCHFPPARHYYLIKIKFELLDFHLNLSWFELRGSDMTLWTPLAGLSASSSARADGLQRLLDVLGAQLSDVEYIRPWSNIEAVLSSDLLTNTN